MMDVALPFKESDLLSFGGLIALLPVLALGINRFVRLKPERMHLVILLLSYAIGCGAKATIKMAYTGVSWVGMLVALFLTAIAACQAFDSASGNLPANSRIGISAADSLGGQKGGTQDGPKAS